MTLDVTNLTVAFGGAVAVDGLSLAAAPRQITGLIGPNGAGKTTTFNAICGLLKPKSGSVRLGGADLTRLPPSARARRGLGRTFQRMELVNAMTVRMNVALGEECRVVGANPLAQVFTTPGQRRAIATRAENALEVCGLGHLADRTTGTLSTGQRRLVELARVLAGGFSMLLLDEPSSGLDEDETQAFGTILRRVISERDLGILLVEHDMALVMDVCADIFVLEFGRLIFQGPPAACQTSALVRAAYLGGDLESTA